MKFQCQKAEEITFCRKIFPKKTLQYTKLDLNRHGRIGLLRQSLEKQEEFEQDYKV
jgi:hypothetical protein